MIAKLLSKIMAWGLSKNPGGGYTGEADERWAYTIRAPDGSPYLSRLLLPRVRIPLLGEWRPMLHYFHRPDRDQHPHNHPWKRAFSVVLAGAYEEERVVGDPRPHRYMLDSGQCGMCGLWRGECEGHPADTDTKVVRRFNALTGDDYHRVTKLRGEVWTLFVAGEQKEDPEDWGFLLETGEHVPFRDYLTAAEAPEPAEATPSRPRPRCECERHPNRAVGCGAFASMRVRRAETGEEKSVCDWCDFSGDQLIEHLEN